MSSSRRRLPVVEWRLHARRCIETPPCHTPTQNVPLRTLCASGRAACPQAAAFPTLQSFFSTFAASCAPHLVALNPAARKNPEQNCNFVRKPLDTKTPPCLHEKARDSRCSPSGGIFSVTHRAGSPGDAQAKPAKTSNCAASAAEKERKTMRKSLLSLACSIGLLALPISVRAEIVDTFFMPTEM